MRKILTLTVSLTAILGLSVLTYAPSVLGASAGDEARRGSCVAAGGKFAGSGKTATCTVDGVNIWKDGGSADLNSIVKTIINVMLFIVGVLSVIMIIYSGIRYVISRGDPSQVKNAKDTLLYSIVGLIVAIVAFAIVQWVFDSLGS